MNYFKDNKNPTMDELINWFQIEFTDLWVDMCNADHAAVPGEPNPYHLEGTVAAHTMMVCMQAEMDNANKINKLCALLHDTGKPESREVIEATAKKPVHTEANEIREADTENSKTKELGREFKTHFRGHEGISVYKATDVLKELVALDAINTKEAEDVLAIISSHGTLFNNIKDGKEYKPQKVADKWKDNQELFELFVNQVRYDSLGRFAKDGRKSDAKALGDTIYGKAFRDKFWPKDELDEGTRLTSGKYVTLLCGVPLSGKSTWLENNLKEDDVVISRDATLLDLGHIKYGKDLDYSGVWKLLTDDDQKEIDKMIRNQFELAILRGNNIFIDMTNTSAKTRKKWLNYQVQGTKDYNRKFRESYGEYENWTLFFICGYDEIFERNIARNKKEGKFIPEFAIKNMMKGLILPANDEGCNAFATEYLWKS